MIVSSTLNDSLTDLAMVEKVDWVDRKLRRIEIKFHMVAVE